MVHDDSPININVFIEGMYTGIKDRKLAEAFAIRKCRPAMNRREEYGRAFRPIHCFRGSFTINVYMQRRYKGLRAHYINIGQQNSFVFLNQQPALLPCARGWWSLPNGWTLIHSALNDHWNNHHGRSTWLTIQCCLQFPPFLARYTWLRTLVSGRFFL